MLNFIGDKDEREELKDSVRKLVQSQVYHLLVSSYVIILVFHSVREWREALWDMQSKHLQV